jgi:hypothetical protein
MEVIESIRSEKFGPMPSDAPSKKPSEGGRDEHQPAETESAVRRREKGRDEALPGEEISGEGSPGLTITGGSGHA